MPDHQRPDRRRSLRLLLTALMVASSVIVIATPAEASTHRWTIGFGSIGPVNTGMTVQQAIGALHSNASSRTSTPYCGLFGLTGVGTTGLTGFAPRRGGRLATLSTGSQFGSSRQGLPEVVQTSRGIGLGSSLTALNRAYPHRLRTTTDYLNQVKVLPGPKGLAIAFELERGKVVNIATGRADLLELPEYCG